VITGYATISSAVETMKMGAFDYLPKPFTPGGMAAVALSFPFLILTFSD
jgi:ActR/RegA family two-component response regulator